MHSNDMITCNVHLQGLVKHVANSIWCDYVSVYQAVSVKTYSNVNQCRSK